MYEYLLNLIELFGRWSERCLGRIARKVGFPCLLQLKMRLQQHFECFDASWLLDTSSLPTWSLKSRFHRLKPFKTKSTSSRTRSTLSRFVYYNLIVISGWCFCFLWNAETLCYVSILRGTKHLSTLGRWRVLKWNVVIANLCRFKREWRTIQPWKQHWKP